MSNSQGVLGKTHFIREMQQLVPPGLPLPQNPEVLETLTSLTQQLIQSYQAEGMLKEDPFAEVWQRSIYLYETEVQQQLENKTILVTGGEGCVGQVLIEKLIELGAKRIISVDKARCLENPETKYVVKGQAEVYQYAIDICHYSAIEQIFQTEKPEIVFHLAAQRLPGVAEIQIRETVTSNILGTQNIIQLCESYHVQKCIYSSTGKASRYFTAEVYAASKKVSEWQFAKAAQAGKVTYGMVRFTHMLNNSAFCQQYDEKVSRSQPVNVHAPHRYIVAQNVIEATHLLLNALVFSEPKKLRFFLCRNLGWPTETLEVALYKILQSGKSLPVYFQGITAGYEEPFFRGQIDWSKPTELHTLINVIENQTRTIDQSGDMIMAEVSPFSFSLLNEHLSHLQALLNDPNFPEANIKQELANAVKDISVSIFAQTSPDLLLKIWHWGIDANHLKVQGISLDTLRDTLDLLVEGLYLGIQNPSLQLMQPCSNSIHCQHFSVVSNQ